MTALRTRRALAAPMAPRSIGEMLYRAEAAGVLLPDPLDFLWRFVVEKRRSSAGRPDRGWAVYMGSVPTSLVPQREALPEWAAAADLLVWRFKQNQRPDQRSHGWGLANFHPDHALLVTGRSCGALSVCLAKSPRPEIAARRFSRWLHAVHELAVCEWRLRAPNEAVIVPWTLAGPADPLLDRAGDWRDRGARPTWGSSSTRR